MLQLNPFLRPTAKEILLDPYFDKVRCKILENDCYERLTDKFANQSKVNVTQIRNELNLIINEDKKKKNFKTPTELPEVSKRHQSFYSPRVRQGVKQTVFIFGSAKMGNHIKRQTPRI